MAEERFMKLVEAQHGFEFVQAYRDDIDHFLGGLGDTCWYVIVKDGRVQETCIGTCRDGVWTDRQIKGTGARKKEKVMPAGSTIRRIEAAAYLGQSEDWVTRRTPKLIQDSHPHYHYVYGFGDKALDVSEAYGVTIGWSDLKDVPAGFHLRDVKTGKEVEMP